MLEWFLTVIYKEHTLIRFANPLSRSHPTLSFWLRRENWQMFRLNFMIRIHCAVIFSFYSRVCLKCFRTITLKSCLSKSEFSFSEQPLVFYKKGVLKSFTIFTGKHLCRSLFFINLKTFRPSGQQLYQKGSPTQVFSQWTLRIFQEHLICRTSANGCFWYFISCMRQWFCR